MWGLDDAQYDGVKNLIFCEAPVETLYEESFPFSETDIVFAIEYLPGQFDQRADSAEQCIQIVARKRPKVACARVFVLSGELSDADVDKIKKYLINAVDSREASLEKPKTLERASKTPPDVARIVGFIKMDDEQIAALHAKMSLAMSVADLAFCRDHFASVGRDPSITEIRVLDTYWSDHCRHTTFLTRLENVEFAEGAFNAPAKASWKEYLGTREELKLKGAKSVCLMDVALIGCALCARQANRIWRSEGNKRRKHYCECRCRRIRTELAGDVQNETHNHPTEMGKPFGGAATCLGGPYATLFQAEAMYTRQCASLGPQTRDCLLKRLFPASFPSAKL
ncbi:MAG: hypothetical protein ACLUKN_16780 [Bacilli bacterium]